ncbi:MAG: chemotaxis protein CheD [Spirochaetales bacterium]|nr:chemotaxis protein CheD [Spirochaetales bacterium]
MDSKESCPYVMTGQIHTSSTGGWLRTTVGSCISVCLYDNRLKQGGMNHFILSRSPDGDNSDRYGNNSIVHMIEKLRQEGSNRSDLTARIIGVGTSITISGTDSAGSRNIKVAESVLQEESIRVVERHTGGCHGRKIFFNTGTGQVEATALNDCLASCKFKGSSCKNRLTAPVAD